MKRRAQPIISIRRSQPFNCAFPLKVSNATQGFTDDGFLVLDLPVVSNVLPVATSGRCIIGAVRLLAVRRGLENFDNPCSGVVFLLLDDLHFKNVSRRAPRNENDTLIGTRETGSSVYQFLDCETHDAPYPLPLGEGRVRVSSFEKT